MQPDDPWIDARLAALLLAVDPAGLCGACVHGRAGAPRDAWLAFFRTVLPTTLPLRRVPLHVSDERLFGGVDWLDALRGGKASYQAGILESCSGGFLVLPSSERMSARLCSQLVACLDGSAGGNENSGATSASSARVGIVALDERLPDEAGTPDALIDRLAFLIDADAFGSIDAAPTDATAVERARAHLPRVAVCAEVIAALCGAAAALGVHSLRAALLAVRAARASAALAGRTAVDADDAQVAARLVLAPRATQAPPDNADTAPAADAPLDAHAQRPANDAAHPDDATEPATTAPQPDDVLLAATLAALPKHLLERAAPQGRGARARQAEGRRGPSSQAAARGRPSGIRSGKPRQGARLNLVETLRAAAPWQRARREAAAAGDRRRVRICATDLRITRHKQPLRTTTLFVVDASGSAALHRLAEAKGAVELLLADCYVRRDQVCVIAFRGTRAEVLLPPTRSLARAKRQLAGLPGGGATPLPAALQLAAATAQQIVRAGFAVAQVILTDGSANVALDGSFGRERAEADARAMAARLRALGTAVTVIDIAPRAQRQTAELAQALGARYLWLPRADAASISGAVLGDARTVS